jgi:type I restriction enzyme S subunit
MKDSRVEWIGTVPSDWQLRKIGAMYNQRLTKTNDIDNPALSVTMEGIVPQLNHAAKTDDHENRKLVKAGDFVINSRSDRRGSCGIAQADGSVSLINTVLIPREKMNSSYYNWLFHTSVFASEFYRHGQGIANDLWTTKWQNMKRIYVPAPSQDTQSCIDSYLSKRCKEIDESISRHRSIIDKLVEYRSSLIYNAITGKINCMEATDDA